jgi:SAM-dependent methyltransferase
VPQWNHNIEYFPFIVRVANERQRASAIDVGTGDGMLAAALARSIPLVVGLDSSAQQITIARANYPEIPGLRFEFGDALDPALAGEPFDFVACSATIHHMDLREALLRFRELTAPGGTVVVVGLAKESGLVDWLLSAISVPLSRIKRVRRGWYDHGAPMRDPLDSYSRVHAIAAEIMPGSDFKRRLYWRYSLVWNKPS